MAICDFGEESGGNKTGFYCILISTMAIFNFIIFSEVNFNTVLEESMVGNN
jgi:hypothetical protein